MINEKVDVLLQKNDQYIIDYSNWFECSFDNANSHQDCCPISYELMSGSCDSGVPFDPLKFEHDDVKKQIKVITDIGMVKSYACFRASTYGLVT